MGRFSLRTVATYGAMTWLVPFVVAISLVGRDGQPWIPVDLFKSLMVVVGAAVGAWGLVRVFRLRPRWGQAGLRVGLLWLAINVGLDLLVLVPMTGLTLSAYVMQIGVRYLTIPIMALAVEAALNSAAGAVPRESPAPR